MNCTVDAFTPQNLELPVESLFISLLFLSLCLKTAHSLNRPNDWRCQLCSLRITVLKLFWCFLIRKVRHYDMNSLWSTPNCFWFVEKSFQERPRHSFITGLSFVKVTRKPNLGGLLTWEMLLYEFWIKARSGISMQVRRVNCQDRRSMKNSMPHVFTRLRSNTFTFMATERPILSVSEIKRDVRLPVKDKNLFLSHDIN